MKLKLRRAKKHRTLEEILTSEDIMERLGYEDFITKQEIIDMHEENIKDLTGFFGITEEELRAASAEFMEEILRPFDAVEG